MIDHKLNWARLLTVCSGLAALGWQMIWTSQWSLLLGHEVYSVMAISAAFFGGLGLGTWFTTCQFIQNKSAITVYVIAEIVIALWGIFVVQILPTLNFIGPFFLGISPSPLSQGLFSFAFPMILLLPATAAMGVTLPSLLKAMQLKSQDLADLYALNTLGAMLGVVSVVFYSVPSIGMTQSAQILVLVNLLCAFLMSLVWKFKLNSSQSHSVSENKFISSWNSIKIVQQFFPIFCLGFFGISYQVIAVRVLSLVTENTVYSYALILVVYLIFHASGAALFKFTEKNKHRFTITHEQTFTLLIASILVGALGLSQAANLYFLPSKYFDESFFTALSGETLAALAALAIPSAAMGFIFSKQSIQFEKQSGWVGLSMSFNILGAAFAPLIIGLLVFPHQGTAISLGLVLLGYTLMQSFKTFSDSLKLWPICIFPLALIGDFSWNFLTVPQGGKLLFYEDGLMASVSVVQDIKNIAHLQINNRVQEGSSASGWVERRLAILPLMFHNQPQQVLMLGLGTGFTAAAAAEYGNTQVQAVELLPEVVSASELFKNYPNFPKPRSEVKVVTADARRFINSSPSTFDVIISDLFHPARSGAASLYTVEHFQKIKDKLNTGGVFCQWLALHQMDLQTLQTVVASYLIAFPDAKAVLASNSLDSPVVGLISRKNSNLPLMAEMKNNWLDSEKATSANKAKLQDPYAVWGSVIAGSESLHRFSKNIAPNTDDNLQVSYKAPKVTYEPQETPRQRLNQISIQWSISPIQGESVEVQNRLAAYWQAHKKYLQIGLGIKNGSDPLLILTEYQDQLFELIHLSSDFRPAYDTLNSLARSLMSSHPDVANQVISKLHRLSAEQHMSAEN
jgi:spermidine synthase